MEKTEPDPFCSRCSAAVAVCVPAGDTHPRRVCTGCGAIHYDNPKVLVGSVATWQDRVLLVRRAIPPRRNHWTLPAGFLELGESSADGAVREAREEANASIVTGPLLGVFDLPYIGQVQLIYRAQLTDATISPGDEALQVALFGWHDIPWDDLAFVTVAWALQHAMQWRSEATPLPLVQTKGEP